MWPFTKEIKEKGEIDFNYQPSINEGIINEQFKGEIELKTIKFPKELGEEHPFDFKEMEELYKKFGFFTAVVDKYVDFVVGPGFYVECEDDRALKIIEDFIVDVNLDTLLRAWCKEGLVKGNGFMEIGGSKKEGVKGLKVLNANYMYVVRDKFGKVLGYNQYKGAFDKFAKDKVVNFTPDNIAHFAFNVVGDCAYGQGIGYCGLKDIDNLLQTEKDDHFIMKRKANSPLHAQLGKVDGNVKIIPKQEDVTAFGQKLETMSNKTEWATDPLVNFKVIDYGNIGEKFAAILEHDVQKLFYIFQIPPELMGMANIPEGMAQVRMDAFERRIQSIQAEVEKVVEQQIFKRVLNANGFDVHVEFQWGRPSNQEKSDRLMRLKEFMNNPRMSDTLFKMMEQDVVKILDYNEDEYISEVEAELEKQKELQRAQPIVPGQNANAPQLPPKEKVPQPKATESFDVDEFIRKKGDEWCVFSHQTGKNFGCYPSEEQAKKRLAQIHAFSNAEPEVTEKELQDLDVELKPYLIKKKIKSNFKERGYEYQKSCPHCTEAFEEINDIEEWLGFNYKKYLFQIEQALKRYDFNQVRALTEAEKEAGYLSNEQVEQIRDVLDKGFKQGSSIRDMAREIDKKVNLPDLYRMTEDGDVKRGASGLPILAKSADKRSIGIVRTEVTRMANLGAVNYYKENGVDKVRWVASIGDRTCQHCEDLNGQMWTIGNEPEMPAHPLCRCTYAPVVELR